MSTIPLNGTHSARTNRVADHFNFNTSSFATSQGESFRQAATAPLSQFVAFLAEVVLVRDGEGAEQPVAVGVAAEIRSEAEAVSDEIGQLLLGLVSQDFAAAHKLELVFDSERDQASRILSMAEDRNLAVDECQALYHLTARALIRCGYKPARVAVPEGRLLTPDETLELCVAYWLGMPVADIEETNARYQAHHNPLVDFLLKDWRVIVDRDLRQPVTGPEARAIHPIPAAAPAVTIGYESNDIRQTAASVPGDEAEVEGPAEPKPKAQRAARKRPAHVGPPRARISPASITYIASEFRHKSSLILDIILRRLAADPRAAGISPGQHALAFARRNKGGSGKLVRTKHVSAFDFDFATESPFFGGRSSLAVTINDIDGKEYHPETFGQSQSRHVQSTDALIIPIDTDALQPGAEARATEDAIFLARLVDQYRYRPGLPIAVVVPAADKLMTEDELSVIHDGRIMPAEFPRPLLTSAAKAEAGRISGGVARRMRHAAFQNPGVTRSLNVLRLVDRLFTRYDPLFREAVAITGAVEVFFTMTSTADSGWSRTYGSVEVVDWIAQVLEQQIRPILPGLIQNERARLTETLSRVSGLRGRINELEDRRSRLRHRREATTTARIVLPWNKPDRIQQQDQRAEAAIAGLTADIEAALGLKPNGRSSIDSRRSAIAAAITELEARLRSTQGV